MKEDDCWIKKKVTWASTMEMHKRTTKKKENLEAVKTKTLTFVKSDHDGNRK